MISCLIFDLDGTLVDSSAANVKSYSQVFSDVGLEFPAEKYRSSFGLRFPEMMDHIAPGSDAEQRAKIKTLKAKYYVENINLVRLNDSLLELIKDVKAKSSHKTALVTTASRQNVDNLLSHFSINKDLFNVIIVGEDVVNGKPEPECYIKAIEFLKVKPEECIVFEDSQVGHEAAIKAGAKVVKVNI